MEPVNVRLNNLTVVRVTTRAGKEKRKGEKTTFLPLSQAQASKRCIHAQQPAPAQ